MAIKLLFCIFRMDLIEYVRFNPLDVLEEVGTRRRKDMYAPKSQRGSMIITECRITLTLTV